ncbi:MAG: hypothetical protein ACI8S6_000087 [Myxococcota bacterium]|jgi:hypothetical protein
MSVTRQELQEILTRRDPRQLERVLDASEVWFPEGSDGAELSRRLVDALWWRTHSPLGKAVLPDALDDLVERYERKLGMELGVGDAWQRLEALTAHMLPTDRALSVEELPEDARKKLEKALWLDMAGVSLAGSSAGARWAARTLLKWTKGPLWDLIKHIPRLGPALGTIRIGAGKVALVSGPLGITVALLTLNHTLGPDYDRALPLLLGVGLVSRNPVANT